MEFSATNLGVLLGFLSIAILLRVFGRNLRSMVKSFSKKKRRMLSIGLIGLVLVGVVVIVFAKTFTKARNNSFAQINPPYILSNFKDVVELNSSNPGVFKSIKQRVCIAVDSVGVVLCTRPNAVYIGYSNMDLNLDKNGRVTFSGNYHNYQTLFNGYNNSESITYSEFNSEDEEPQNESYIYLKLIGDSIVSADTTFRNNSFENGLLVEDKRIRDDSVLRVVKYRYDDFNRNIEKSTYSADSSGTYSLIEREMISYLADSIKETKIYIDGRLVRTNFLIFNDEGQCVKVRAIRSDGQLTEALFKYDSDGRIIQYQTATNGDLESERILFYDSEDRIVRQVESSFSSDSTTMTVSKLFEFNSNGDVASYIDSTFFKGVFSHVVSSRYRYEYDSEHGQYWTKMTIYVDGKVTHLIKREYQFY